tara:strand:+ start:897 stop:1253 length:357 start_codon:yes stop_codon:yes gene_type:complete
MSDVYKNRSVDLTTTGQTTVYTVPTADVSTTPPQKPVQAIIKSIRVCNDSGGAVTLTLVNTDASVGGDIKIVNALSISSNASVEILDQPMVVEDSDVIKATASGANALHVILSVLEIS